MIPAVIAPPERAAPAKIEKDYWRRLGHQRPCRRNRSRLTANHRNALEAVCVRCADQQCAASCSNCGHEQLERLKERILSPSDSSIEVINPERQARELLM